MLQTGLSETLESHIPAKASLGLVFMLGALTAFAPLSIDSYLPSLPSIARTFHVSTEATQATLAAFLAGLAIGQLFYGPASDRWGRRAPVFFGVGLYVVASVMCALAPSIEMLTAARFLQALGGGAGAVVARAIVRDRFNHRDSARVLSMLMLVSGVAPIVAPAIGGQLLVIGGWRLNFWLLTAIGAVILIAALATLKESRSEDSAAQARSEHPIRAYVALLSDRRLVGFVLAGALNAAALFSYISAAAGLLITTYGVRPDHFFWFFSANSAALVAMSQWNRVMLRRRTPEQIVALVRPITLVFAALLFVDAWSGLGGMWGVLIPLFFIIGSFGLVTSNTMAGGLNLDARRAGSISALMGSTQFGFGALASFLISLAHDNGPRPLALAVLICMVGSAAALYGLALRKEDVAAQV